ncbi:hypothetical protein G5714_004397 [Onychostoma macrolepis]|uniref:Uncharacterized protein n=1 Tax=Onychostoma macrolepis TaxID=369639 RepID=A0A7J6D5E5_9TELE|nr:hypothetical protein G5714_004397 [Onychostoma macrolepis]
MAETKSNQSCSVPFCVSTRRRNNRIYRFIAFPMMKKPWIWAIRRDEGAAFTSGRKFLTPQAVPSRFSWNDWGDVKSRQTRMAKRGVCGEQEEADVEMESVATALPVQEHDLQQPPSSGQTRCPVSPLLTTCHPVPSFSPISVTLSSCSPASNIGHHKISVKENVLQESSVNIIPSKVSYNRSREELVLT